MGGFNSLAGHVDTVKDIEDGTADLEAELAKIQEKIAERKKRKGIKNAKPTPVAFESAFDAQVQTLRASMPNDCDEDFFQELLIQLVRRLEEMNAHSDANAEYTGPNYYANLCTQRGKVQGIAAVLAIIRGTTIAKETLRAITLT